MDWKYTDFPVKKKLQAQRSVNIVMKGAISIDFLEKLKLQTVLLIVDSFGKILVIYQMTLELRSIYLSIYASVYQSG